MGAQPTRLGIVGLGRWAKVPTRAAAKSNKFKIVAGYSRTEDMRRAFEQEFGVAGAPDMKTLLANPEIRGVIITVPNEQHLPVATEIAKAGKHAYTEKPINERALELNPNTWRWYKAKAPGGPLS